jgi:hypothetical protein
MNIGQECVPIYEPLIRAGRRSARNCRRVAPASGLYLYNPAGAASEPLFRALMQQLPFSPVNKESGLREFKRRGWILVDATYEPVNELSPSKRDRAIVGGYQSLREDLASLKRRRGSYSLKLPRPKRSGGKSGGNFSTGSRQFAAAGVSLRGLPDSTSPGRTGPTPNLEQAFIVPPNVS